MMYRSTQSTPSRFKLRLASATGSFRPGKNFVVMNTSPRGTPLSRNPCPTLSSLPYACAVSICRYPSSSAQRTASTHSRPFPTCQTPRPASGTSFASASTRARPSAVTTSVDIAPLFQSSKRSPCLTCFRVRSAPCLPPREGISRPERTTRPRRALWRIQAPKGAPRVESHSPGTRSPTPSTRTSTGTSGTAPTLYPRGRPDLPDLLHQQSRRRADGQHLELPRHHRSRPSGDLGGLAEGYPQNPAVPVVELPRRARHGQVIAHLRGHADVPKWC